MNDMMNRTFGKVLLLTLVMAWPRPEAGAQDPPPNRLRVLFLGDNGHHQPASRVPHIMPYLADRGIQIFYTDRVENLNEETLARHDVVAMYGNHTHLTRAQEAALLNYVAMGGGFVPIHAASAMFGESDAFISLVGGAFKSHGTGIVRTKAIQPDHPALKGVPAFESWDETYVHMRHNPDKLVLSVREMEGADEPWTWVRSHGDGRVFYTAWGHDERTWSNPGFHRLLEQGIRWAAGDWALTADLAPPPLDYSTGNVPYYPPGEGWGVTGEPITRLQLPLTPEESVRQAAIQPGFRMELFAGDPEIVNPIDMAWDEQGRLWIVETLDYPNTFEPDRQGTDRVKILEDTDDDGRADRVTVFADGLNIATSLTLANGGVIVAQAPDMLFLKDTDGDDRADVREVLFTGWGTFDTHAGPSNLRYGFDNHIWGTVGYSAFNGAVGGDSIRFSQGFFRFAPDGSHLESTASTNNNTWGLGFSEEGLVFGSTANRNPSNFMAIPARYYTRLQGTYGSETDSRRRGDPRVPVLQPIADRAAFYPITSDVRQVDQHGTYTSGAAHELYTARQFPREYWNRVAFVAGPTGHLLGKFTLEPDGADFRAHNEWNMVASRDAWFAPIQARVGPDGALWVIDWYNLIIQHNPTPPDYETGEGNAYESEHRDREHGRIYRIVYDDAPASFSLSDASAEDLVLSLRDDNLYWRLTAQRLLVERGDTEVLPHLYRMVHDERVDELGLNVGAIHALWTMHGLGALDDPEAFNIAVEALHHPSAGVRRTALMVLPPTNESLEAILQAGLLPDRTGSDREGYMVDSSVMDQADAQVRLAALLAIADMPASNQSGTTDAKPSSSEQAGEAVAELLLIPDNATDRWIRDASAIAGARHGVGFMRRMLREDIRHSDSTYVANLQFALGTASAHNAATRSPDDLFLLLDAVSEADTALAAAFLDGLLGGWPAGAAPSLPGEDIDALRALHDGLGPELGARLRALAVHWERPEILTAD